MTEATEEKGAYQKLVEYNTGVIDSWLKRSGTQTASIRVCVNGKGRVFIICFGKKDFDKVRSPRWVRIDPRVLDPFDKDDKLEMERLKLVMFFAEHLGDFEKELVDTPKSKKLYSTWWWLRRKLYGGFKID